MSTGTHGSFVWYDLLTPDPDAAAAFYREIVGWTSQPFPEGGVAYTMFVGGQGPLAGTTKPEQAGVRPQWVANVFVDDVDATAALAAKLAGRVWAPPADYPPVGRLAVLGDPQGVPINVFKPSRPMEMHDATRPGEFTWRELMTSDHEAAFGYYSQLFGWKKLRDFDMGGHGKYLLYGQGHDDRELGGMFTKDKDAPMPPAWIYYIQVADLDAAIARAKGHGGTLMNGPMEVPGGARIAHLTDPQGAFFALHESAAPKLAT
ncbi:MAG TPA: VOC family protein [Polyangia bacterium]|nr:VOC family protein [Polyangia bacterium]